MSDVIRTRTAADAVRAALPPVGVRIRRRDLIRLVRDRAPWLTEEQANNGLATATYALRAVQIGNAKRRCAVRLGNGYYETWEPGAPVPTTRRCSGCSEVTR